MSDKGVCGTAPATPGLLKSMFGALYIPKHTETGLFVQKFQRFC